MVLFNIFLENDPSLFTKTLIPCKTEDKNNEPTYVFSIYQAFPGSGFPGNVFIGEIDYYNNWEAMDKVKHTLENDPYIAKGSVNSWYHHYHSWLNVNHQEYLIPEKCNESKLYTKIHCIISSHSLLSTILMVLTLCLM